MSKEGKRVPATSIRRAVAIPSCSKNRSWFLLLGTLFLPAPAPPAVPWDAAGVGCGSSCWDLGVGRQVWVINPALHHSSASVTCPLAGLTCAPVLAGSGQRLFHVSLSAGVKYSRLEGVGLWEGEGTANSGSFLEEFAASPSQTAALGLPWPRLC